MISSECSVDTDDTFEIDEELLEIFSGEAEDLLNKIFASLATILSGQSPLESLWEIRRSAHTLKGAAGAVGLDAVAELAHLFEDAVDAYSGSSDGDICLLTDIAAALPVSIHQDPDQVRERIRSFRSQLGSEHRPRSAPADPHLAAKPKLASTNPSSVARVSLLKVDRCVELSSSLSSADESTASYAEMLAQQTSELSLSLRSLGRYLDSTVSSEVRKCLREITVIESSIARLSTELQDKTAESESIVAELTVHLGSMRSICFGTIEPRLRGSIRAAADEAGTRCEFAIENGEVEIDTVLLAEMAEPILHVLRNAAVHGIEPPEERSRYGKTEMGNIVLSVRHVGEGYEILISDDGRGIDVERLKDKAVESGSLTADEAEQLSSLEAFDLIFLEGLSTAKSVGMTAGRGVGMRIVKESVESRGGTVRVESQKGSGTVFRLLLPAVAQLKDTVQKNERDVGFCTDKTILLVDDSASVRFSASSILRANGWNVLTANDGEDALGILDGLPSLPTAVISDVEMPQMDGLRFLSVLKENDRYSGVAVVMCSSRNDEQCIRSAKKLGAAGFIVKPFSEEDLLAEIERVIR